MEDLLNRINEIYQGVERNIGRLEKRKVGSSNTASEDNLLNIFNKVLVKYKKYIAIANGFKMYIEESGYPYSTLYVEENDYNVTIADIEDSAYVWNDNKRDGYLDRIYC